jgi:hypothetical protein
MDKRSRFTFVIYEEDIICYERDTGIRSRLGSFEIVENLNIDSDHEWSSHEEDSED